MRPACCNGLVQFNHYGGTGAFLAAALLNTVDFTPAEARTRAHRARDEQPHAHRRADPGAGGVDRRRAPGVRRGRHPSPARPGQPAPRRRHHVGAGVDARRARPRTCTTSPTPTTRSPASAPPSRAGSPSRCAAPAARAWAVPTGRVCDRLRRHLAQRPAPVLLAGLRQPGQRRRAPGPRPRRLEVVDRDVDAGVAQRADHDRLDQVPSPAGEAAPDARHVHRRPARSRCAPALGATAGSRARAPSSDARSPPRSPCPSRRGRCRRAR